MFAYNRMPPLIMPRLLSDTIASDVAPAPPREHFDERFDQPFTTFGFVTEPVGQSNTFNKNLLAPISEVLSAQDADSCAFMDLSNSAMMGLPSFAPSAMTGLPSFAPSAMTGLPSFAASAVMGLPTYTRSPFDLIACSTAASADQTAARDSSSSSESQSSSDAESDSDYDGGVAASHSSKSQSKFKVSNTRKFKASTTMKGQVKKKGKAGRRKTDFRTKQAKTIDRRVPNSKKSKRENVAHSGYKKHKSGDEATASQEHTEVPSPTKMLTQAPIMQASVDNTAPTKNFMVSQAPIMQSSVDNTAPTKNFMVSQAPSMYASVSKAAPTKHFTVPQAPNTYSAPTTSKASNTRHAIQSTPLFKYKKEVGDNLSAWRNNLKMHINQYLNVNGGPTTAGLLQEVFAGVNRQCYACHPGALHSDGCACSGTTTIVHMKCGMTAIEDTKEFIGMLCLTIKGGTKVTLNKGYAVQEGATIARYRGARMTNDDFLALPTHKKALAIQEKDSTSWIVPPVQKFGPNWTADVKNPGARIAFSTGTISNCIVQQTTDGSLVVVATRAIKGGDELLYPRV
jgi:hypothetical protein